jgi:cytochrome P450
MLATAERVLQWPFSRTRHGRPPVEFDLLRTESACPVELPAGATESRRAWLVSAYDDVRQALMDPRLSADEGREGAPVRIQLPPGERPSSFLRMDDPDHARLRNMITSEFTAHRVRAVRPVVQQRIDELLDNLEASPGAADLQQVFTRALPTMIIAGVLGVPAADTLGFVELTRTVLSQGDPAAAFAAYQQMTGYLRELAVSKLASPGDDLISRVATKHVRAGDLTIDELAGIARLVLVAGHETTTNQLALNVLSLLLDANLRSQVLADGGAKIPQYVEEAMRYWSISQDAILRQATVDLELGGVQMRAGDAVVISIPAADNDPAAFADPDVIRLDRKSGMHLQWGYGAHFCIGAPLARLEMELALRSLFERFPSLKLAVDDPAPLYRTNTVFFGVEELPVTWDAGLLRR